MKAAVLQKKGKLTYEEVLEPNPFSKRSVLVRVAAAGVCGSDIVRYAQGTAYHFPLVLGHEFSALVEEAPTDSRFDPGDRVVVFPLIPDPDDPFVKVGELAVSSGYDYFGSRRDGAFAERLYIPEENLLPIPDTVSLVEAATVEPAAVSLHAITRMTLPANATTLVIGGGPIGAFAAMWLRILGAARIFVADVDARKRDILQSQGFEVIDAALEDTVQVVRELTGGGGVDCAIEACGLPKTLCQCIEAVDVFGQVVMLGDHHHDVTLSGPMISSILRRELVLYGTWNSKIMPAGNNEWEMVLSHMCKDFTAVPFISHTPSLDEAPRVFADMAEHRIWYNKVVFVIAEEARKEQTGSA